MLQLRAKLLESTRAFFKKRDVLEVETPLLCAATVTDPHIASIEVSNVGSSRNEQAFFLQTSPEYAMKRLLAAEVGSIYQITKAFRKGDRGKWHQPEFTLLEWYRINFDHHQLMDEMDAFLKEVLQVNRTERYPYQEIFLKYLGINPHSATIEELKNCANEHIPSFSFDLTEKSDWLDFLFAHAIESHLGKTNPVFIYDYPIELAALSQTRVAEFPLASRFEVYFKGIELANGFHELQDANEQRKRFETNQKYRLKYGLPFIPIDEKFLAALQHGLPNCAGVALGFDRLCMLLFNKNTVAEVISFSE